MSSQKTFQNANPDYNWSGPTTTVTHTTTTNAPVTRTYTTTNAPVVRSSRVVHTQAPTTTTRVVHNQAPTTTYRTSQAIRTSNVAERRLDEQSARVLARKVFGKYDANGSRYMNSMETAQMISDLYSSLNVDHPAVREEGLEFMIANDANSDNSISLQDFEDIFVQHLSTGDNSGFRLFLDDNTYATRNNDTGRILSTHGPTTVHQKTPQNINEVSRVVQRQTVGGTTTYSRPTTQTYTSTAQQPTVVRRA
eukprot:TRINITY_DN39165_c0_g1_i1.p2 TRINITY_DN39165_c0_g1~~TRINITY_DN39165_c0_g1_i1.p2  ORF type:complete len:251 (+),score=31.56 TRINITY_DN39165_c0_g1_i1:3-755(+)